MVLFFMGDKAIVEQGLASLERARFAAGWIYCQERGAGTERSPDTLGQDERPCGTTPWQDP